MVPIETIERGYNTAAILSILLLPYMDVKLPEIGMPKNEPTGKNNSIAPNSASFNPNCILMSGILLAQLAKQIPVKKKKPDKTIRLVLLEIGDGVIAQR